MSVEGEGEREKTQKGHRPTFTRAHTLDEIHKMIKAKKDKPLSIEHADNISRGVTEWWKRRKAQQTQEVAGEMKADQQNSTNQHPEY